MMCAANYPNHGEDLKAKSILWMQTFINKDDGLMETAIISCLNYCKKFPTIADIREAIKDLQYEQTTKPKQIAYEVKKNEKVLQQIKDITSGKVDIKELASKIDRTKLLEYAKIIFPDMATELVLRNSLELMQVIEQQEKCFACRTQKQACEGWMVKHYLDFKTGWISNQMAKCNKQIRS